MIRRGTVLCLGLAQLVSWGTTYYLIGGFGPRIIAETGWSHTLVHGGFSAALLVMGLSSAWIGRLIDRRGGRFVMTAGSVLSALGCAGLALARDPVSYYAAWLVLGLAMRCTLYDAAFAALARIGGAEARRPMAQITLLGGLASTAFWPIGEQLAAALGWRGAVFAYAGFALLTVPLHLALPAGRTERARPAAAASRPLAGTRREHWIAGGLYALIITLTNALNAGMSAHMIGILAGLGLAAPVAVWVATLRGIGQSGARLAEVLFGGGLSPLGLTLAASAVLPVCFLAGLWGGQVPAAAIAFAFLYGAGNGLLTITRGTLPLVLFDPDRYGAIAGRLLVPGFLCSAAAPVAYAAVIERLGEAAALWLSAALAAVTLAAAAGLCATFRTGRAAPMSDP
ncbi:MFS transporter [Inquilinus sp. NPDC058860]|uniref:MFS transporter n=1 Tax=Inquilinus sp. NPDC058860 TaxID=3346652 RepID=UPI0036ADA4D3